MTNKNLIHVKLEYSEAIRSKKEILFLQQESLKVAKIMKTYRSLRLKELLTKMKLLTKMNSLLIDMKKLKRLLPKFDVQEKPSEKTKAKAKAKTAPKDPESDIELQLREIQEKLNALQSA